VYIYRTRGFISDQLWICTWFSSGWAIPDGHFSLRCFPRISCWICATSCCSGAVNLYPSWDNFVYILYACWNSVMLLNPMTVGPRRFHCTKAYLTARSARSTPCVLQYVAASWTLFCNSGEAGWKYLVSCALNKDIDRTEALAICLILHSLLRRS